MHDVDPWTPQRDDMRAAVASLWARGAGFDALQIDYPYTPDDSDDDYLIALMDHDHQKKQQHGHET